MTLERWKSEEKRRPQDKLLLRYWQLVGGLVFAEVRVGGPGPGPHWPEGSKARRIDGVRVLPFTAGAFPGDIVKFGERQSEEFENQIAGAWVETIEVGATLGRYVIGQAIVGADLLHMGYGPAGVEKVIVCGQGDPLLESWCQEHGIKVWVAPPE